MKALADTKVGELVSRYFVASFQKVGTFTINQGTKQGGNVAVYFAATDGRVLHAIAGPIAADRFRREVEWVVDTVKEKLPESQGNAEKFRQLMRQAHAYRLADLYGLRVTPFAEGYSPQTAGTNASLRNKEGVKVVTKLPLPDLEARVGPGVALDNQAKVHRLMAGHAMKKIEQVYGAVFEDILGETVSTQPVQVKTPFPSVRRVRSDR